MFFCESCRVKNSWPQSFGGSYGRCELCGNEDSCYDMPSKLLPKPKTSDVHTAHCCQKHGCKYGSVKCTVMVNGGQEQMCDECHEELYESGEWETAHLMHAMFVKGQKYAWREIVKLSNAANWELKA